MKIGDIIEIATPVVNHFPLCCPVGHWGAISSPTLSTSTLRKMVGGLDRGWAFTDNEVKLVGRMVVKRVK